MACLPAKVPLRVDKDLRQSVTRDGHWYVVMKRLGAVASHISLQSCRARIMEFVLRRRVCARSVSEAVLYPLAGVCEGNPTASFMMMMCHALMQAGDMQAMEYQLQQANLTVPGLNAPSMASPAAAAAAASPATLPLPPPPPLAQAQARSLAHTYQKSGIRSLKYISNFDQQQGQVICHCTSPLLLPRRAMCSIVLTYPSLQRSPLYCVVKGSQGRTQEHGVHIGSTDITHPGASP
jgi:hypothetical protein